MDNFDVGKETTVLMKLADQALNLPPEPAKVAEAILHDQLSEMNEGQIRQVKAEEDVRIAAAQGALNSADEKWKASLSPEAGKEIDSARQALGQLPKMELMEAAHVGGAAFSEAGSTAGSFGFFLKPSDVEDVSAHFSKTKWD